jgi:Zn-dependent M28 family amino/carboxypeptidase
MEIARRLSSPAFAAQTQRTVRFALFNVEEEGLDGSFEHARLAELRAGEEQIVGVINLEMIGYFTDEPNSQRSPIPRIPGVFEPPTVGNTITLVANQASSAFARELNDLMRSGSPLLKTFLVDFIPGNGDAIPDTQRSDHAPFWMIGVPAVMVTDTSNFRNPHYHKPTDTIETLDLKRMTRVVEGVEHAVRVMSGASASRAAQ